MNKKNLSLEFKVGLFAIITIFLIFIFIFSQTKKGQWRTYEIGVMFDYIGGLDIGSPVRLSGVMVGEVKNIQILVKERPKVLVTLTLRRNVKVGKGSVITIRTLGIIGEKYVEIIPSSEKQYLTAGEIVEGVNPISLEQFVTIGQDVIYNLNGVLTDLRKVTSDIEIQKNVKEIIGDTSLAVKQMNSVLSKVDDLSTSVDKTNLEIRDIITKNSPKIEELINNTNSLILTGKDEIEKTSKEIRKFAKTSQDIEETVVKIGNTADEINTFFENLQNKGLIAQIMKEEDLLNQIKVEVEYLQDTTIKLKESAENINSFFNYINEGQGSIGKFVKSDELYNEVLGLIKDIKAHPWKLFFRGR